MLRSISLILVLVAALSHGARITTTATTAAVSPTEAQSLYDRVARSLVAVQYTLETELGRQ